VSRPVDMDAFKTQFAIGSPCRVSGCVLPAACFGSYEGDGAWAFSCGVHCGHGNEDGRCYPESEIVSMLVASWRKLAAVREAAKLGIPHLCEQFDSGDGSCRCTAAVLNKLLVGTP